MSLDVATLLTVLVMVSAMAAAFVWFLYSGHRPIPGIKAIAWSNTLVCIGFLGVIARPVLPTLVSFMGANALICAGYLVALYGMAAFFRSRVNPLILAMIGAAYCAEFAYFYYVQPSYNTRLFCYLMFYSLVIAYVLRLTVREYRRTGNTSHLAAAGVAGLLCVSFFACALLPLFRDRGTDVLSPNWVNALVIVEQIFFVVGWTLSFTLMVSERLNQERIRAEADSKVKSEALANMSHELRTPLKAIIGFADVIDSKALGENSPKYAEYIKDIRFSGQHLLLLINDILDISRIESGKLELHEERVEIAGLVESVRRMTGPRAEAAGVTVSCTLDSPFKVTICDELRLRQILVNLLVNAVKFTPEGGRVDISTLNRPGGGGAFVIADTGIGMDAAGIKRALTKYCQVESTLTHRQEGIGLGLPLAVALTEAHGGRLEIASTPGIGTTITVDLPAFRCPAAEALPAP